MSNEWTENKEVHLGSRTNNTWHGVPFLFHLVNISALLGPVQLWQWWFRVPPFPGYSWIPSTVEYCCHVFVFTWSSSENSKTVLHRFRHSDLCFVSCMTILFLVICFTWTFPITWNVNKFFKCVCFWSDGIKHRFCFQYQMLVLLFFSNWITIVTLETSCMCEASDFAVLMQDWDNYTKFCQIVETLGELLCSKLTWSWFCS